VVLVDADRQASLAEWLEERPVEGVTIVEAPSERTLARAMNSHEGLAIVDTPTTSDSCSRRSARPTRSSSRREPEESSSHAWSRRST
jgi:hypothetical protein